MKPSCALSVLAAGLTAAAAIVTLAPSGSAVTTPTWTLTQNASDSFTRTVTTGWGTAPQGGAWTTATAAAFSVAANQGRVAAPPAGVTLVQKLANVHTADELARITFIVPKLPTGTSGQYVMVRTRVQPDGSSLAAQVHFFSTGAMSISLFQINGTTSTVLVRGAADPYKAVSGGKYSLDLQTTGAAPTTTVIARAFPTTAAGPAWQASATATGPSTAGGLAVSLYDSTAAHTGPAVGINLTNLSGWALTNPQTVTPPPSGPCPGSSVIAGFVHPGVLLSTCQLDEVKNRMVFTRVSVGGHSVPRAAPKNSAVAADVHSAAAFNLMMSSNGFRSVHTLASLGYQAAPPTSLVCLAHTTAAPCIALDAQAAYIDALIYYYSGDTEYADQAIQILNAWARTVSRICNDNTGACESVSAAKLTDTFTAWNTQLCVGWLAQAFLPAAEIIRYTYHPSAGRPTFDTTRFAQLMTAFATIVEIGEPPINPGANWRTSFAEGTMDIGVFLNNAALYARGVSMWKQATSIIYMGGAQPIGSWWTSPVFVPGLAQEMCRDISHDTMGLDGLMRGAETASIQSEQGVDLYGYDAQRLVAGYEFNAEYAADALDHAGTGTSGVITTGNSSKTGISYANVNVRECGGKIQIGGYGWLLGWEIGYHHYHDIAGVAMPYTGNFVENYTRPSTIPKSALFLTWETLTFGD